MQASSPSKTLVIHAHPHPRRSLVTEGLKAVFDAAPHTRVRSLYHLYPDFNIDVSAEQQALDGAQLVVWLAPVYWYSVPALMKQWFESVLSTGWAYGPGGEALRGKAAWWVASAGGDQAAYAADAEHARPLADFAAPIEQTARYCGMHWLPPFVVHAGQTLSEAERQRCCDELGQQLAQHQAALEQRGVQT